MSEAIKMCYSMHNLPYIITQFQGAESAVPGQPSFESGPSAIWRQWWDQREEEQSSPGFLLCLFVSSMSEVYTGNKEATATAATAFIISRKDRWLCPAAIITLIKRDAL